MSKLILFSGTDCQLCDIAKQLLNEVLPPGTEVTEINVKQERQFYHEYGARIPVLKNQDTGAELGWPFDKLQLQEFLS